MIYYYVSIRNLTVIIIFGLLNFLVFIVFLKKMLHLFSAISHRSSANQGSVGLKWIVLRLIAITIEDSKESWRITSQDHPFFCTRISFIERNLLIRYFSNRSFSSSLIIRKRSNSNSYFLKSKGHSSIIKNIISYWLLLRKIN